MNPIYWLVNTVLDIYMFFIIVAIIISWLVHFKIVNPYQPFMQQVITFLSQMTEPAYRRIRKIIPPMGAIDLSPLVLIIGVQFVQVTFNWLWAQI